MTKKVKIYTDGGSRGNPGPAALGVIIKSADTGLKKYSQYLGKKTNNEAEYEAVVFALKKAKSLCGKKSKIILNVDSQLVARQLNGQYKVNHKRIQPLFLKVWNLMRDFAEVKINHIKREKNKEADKLVNQELDKKDSCAKLPLGE